MGADEVGANFEARGGLERAIPLCTIHAGAGGYHFDGRFIGMPIRGVHSKFVAGRCRYVAAIAHAYV